MQKFTLERYKMFPVFAWTLVLGFAFFTANLTLQLRNELDSIKDRTQALEQLVIPATTNS